MFNQEIFFKENDLAIRLESALVQIKAKDEKIKHYEEEVERLNEELSPIQNKLELYNLDFLGLSYLKQFVDPYLSLIIRYL